MKCTALAATFLIPNVTAKRQEAAMEGSKDKDLLKELAEYRSGLQNLLAADAVKS